MKGFNSGAEIRLTREDLMEALEYVLNKRILNYEMGWHSVTDITLHPNNKYVLRMEVERKKLSGQGRPV